MSEQQNPGELLRYAGALSDGERVDWRQAAAEHPDLKEQLANMHALESVAQAFRQVGDPAGDDADTRAIGMRRSEATRRPGTKDASTNPKAERHPGSTTRTWNSGDVVAQDEGHAEEMPSRWGHLEILEKIGEGAHGVVYRAHDPQLDHDVALKMLRRDCSGPGSLRFLTEARRLAKVRHDNVITVHGADLHDGRVGLWTELLEGETLESRLMAYGPSNAVEAAGIGVDLCRALAAIHAAQLVHGDVKTANVMRRTEDGRNILMDFSSMCESSMLDKRQERIYGTPLTMAPELFDQKGVPTPATDIYSLGVLLYRLVTRRFPVEAETLEELTGKHRRRESVRLSDTNPNLPADFVAVVERALETEPDKRFKSVGEMQAALIATLPRPDPWWRSRFARYAAVAAVLAGITVAIWGVVRARWEVSADLYRVRGEQMELISSQTTAALTPSDGLFLELRSSRDVHVYVLNEAEKEPGIVNILFPETAAENPVERGVHRLPHDATWGLSTVAGTERIIIVVSTSPRPDLATRFVGQSAPSTDVDSTQTEDQDVHRGLGLRRRDQSVELTQLIEQLKREAQQSNKIWFRVIELHGVGEEHVPAGTPIEG